jgi:hypothetical protein
MLASKKRTGEGRLPIPGGWAVLACTSAVLAAILVYTNALRNPFVYDDHRLILENASLRNPADVRALVLHDSSRPLVNLSYALDYAVWNTRPFGFHLTNLLLHLLNIALLFRLICALSTDAVDQSTSIGVSASQHSKQPIQPVLVAFAAALLFAVHPMMTQAVGYVSGRPELLCCTFFLLAMLSGRRWMLSRSLRWGLLTIASWSLATLSKEIAVMLPFVLVSYDWLLLREPRAERRRRILAVHLPVIGLALLIGAIRLAILAIVEQRGAALPDWHLALVELDVVRRYFWLFMRPVGQTIFHAVAPIQSPLTPRAVVAVCTIGLTVALGWMMRRRHPLAAFGICWFLLLLVPSSVLVMLDRGEPMAEHRTYVAGCGLFMTAGWLASWTGTAVSATSPRARPLVYLLSIMVIFWLGARTVVRNAVWGSPVRIWLEAAEQSPGHWLPRLMLGEALREAGRPEEAIPQYRAAIALRPQEPLAYTKLAQSLAQLGRFGDATATLEQLRRRDPTSAVAFNALGGVAILAGDSSGAREYFEQALRNDPQNVAARQALALLEEASDPAKALRLCEELRRLEPATPGVEDCVRRNRSRIGQ